MKPDYATSELLAFARALEDLGRRIREHTASGEMDALIMYGHKLWLIARRAAAALDGIKETLREEGVARSKGEPGSVDMEAQDGSSCSVVIPKPGLVLKKGVDVEALKETLGLTLFNQFFETVTTYKPREGLRDKLALMAASNPDKGVKAVLDSVAVSEGTPKVYFKE